MKVRLISLIASLSLLAFWLEACARGLHFLGGPGSWFDGH